jgi:prephenate dehydrogenase
MDPFEHDAALALTSHLPHAAASGLAGVTPVGILNLTAGGFRDTTRVAAGDPDLWAAIFEANREAVLGATDRFLTRMTEFRRAVAAGDREALVRWLAEGKRVRDALGS